MQCVQCGNDTYYARQQIYVDVIVDSDGDFMDNLNDDLSSSVYEVGRPYGPFECTQCGKEYDEIK